jgi:hypothetical protein
MIEIIRPASSFSAKGFPVGTERESDFSVAWRSPASSRILPRQIGDGPSSPTSFSRIP